MLTKGFRVKRFSFLFLINISIFSSVFSETRDEIFERLISNHARALQKGVDDNEVFISGLRRLAKTTHKESQYMLGVLGFSGLIALKESIKNLHKSDGNGCAGAAGIIGMLYMEGRFVPKNKMIGLSWIHNAAERGDFGSQVMLGGLYKNGSKETKRDISIAYSWFYQASLLNNPIAVSTKLSLQSLGKNLSRKQIELAKALTLKRLKESGGIKTYFCAHSLPM